jgi:hypothetical protein
MLIIYSIPAIVPNRGFNQPKQYKNPQAVRLRGFFIGWGFGGIGHGLSTKPFAFCAEDSLHQPECNGL